MSTPAAITPDAESYWSTSAPPPGPGSEGYWSTSNPNAPPDMSKVAGALPGTPAPVAKPAPVNVQPLSVGQSLGVTSTPDHEGYWSQIAPTVNKVKSTLDNAGQQGQQAAHSYAQKIEQPAAPMTTPAERHEQLWNGANPPDATAPQPAANAPKTDINGNPEPQVPTGTIQAHEPTLGENVKAAVFGGNLGHAIASTMPALAEKLGIQGAGRETGQALQPEELFQGFLRPTPNAKANPVEDVLTGVGRAAGGLTTGQSLAIMAGAGILPGWMAGIKGEQFVKAALSTGFTVQMLGAMYQHSKQFREEMDKGDPHAAMQTLGEMGVDGVMAFLAGKHAVESATAPSPTVGDPYATSGDIARQALYPNTTPEQEAAAAGKRVTGYTRGGQPIYDTRPSKVEVLPPEKPQPEVQKQLEPFTPDNGKPQEPAWTQPGGAPAKPVEEVLPAGQQTTPVEQKPIGETDKETGRTVLQASDNPDVNQARATAEHPQVKKTLDQAVQSVPGAAMAGARAEKDADRLQEKIEDEGQSPETARDYSGFRIAVDSPEAHQQAVAALRQHFEVPEESDEFDKGADETGFHGHTMQVRVPGSPVTHEVQILPREVADAAEDNHSLYEKAREGDKDAAAQLKAKNEQDWQAFQSRNTQAPKGQAINEGGILQHGEPDILNRPTEEPPDRLAGQSVKTGEEGGRGESPEPTLAGAGQSAPAPVESLASPALTAAKRALTPSGERPARFRLVEADALVPSHNAQSFAKNPEYPEGVQERAYDTSKEAQNRVIQQAQNYDPRYTVNSNPDAVNGPPVITPDGTVLGGNSRAMSTQRLYEAGGDAYKNYLRAHAAEFGLTPQHVDAMQKPVLVREVEAPKNADDMRRLGSELNKSMTGALGVSERAVSAGKNLRPETLRRVADMLQEDDSTLRELMGRRGPELVKMLTQGGAITERERPQFVDASTGGLSEEGKTFVERALMGSVIDDPRLMDSAPKAILQKLERSLGSITSFAARPDEWNLLPALRQAVAEHGAIQRAGSTVEVHLGQRSMFGEERNPLVDAMVRALNDKPNAVREMFQTYARDSEENQHGQTRMLGNAAAFDAFNHAFGSKLTEQEFHDGLVEVAKTDRRNPPLDRVRRVMQAYLQAPIEKRAQAAQAAAQQSQQQPQPN